MTALTTYMWKEWRDQRVQVIGYALLVPFLMAIALLAIPGEWARMDAMPTFVAIGGLLIGALTIASDCVPGELRRGRLEFLARLPCDLRAPFVAKLLFVGIALAGFCVYAWFCATTLSAVLAGGRWFAPFEWTFQYRVTTVFESREMRWSMLHPLIVLAAWIFAVSCWLPRGTLTLPAALLVLSAIGGPALLVFTSHPRLRLFNEEETGLFAWLVASALLMAALTFLRGARHGRDSFKVAGWTLAAALFAAGPVWGWTAWRYHDHFVLDLASDTVALEPIALGDGGRFAFVNTRRCTEPYGHLEEGARHPIVIDLEDGAAHEAGPAETFFELPWRQQSVGTTPLVLLASENDTPKNFAPRDWVDGFDGSSAERLTGPQWKDVLHDRGTLDDRITRARTFVVLADGTRAWVAARTLHVERPGEPARTRTLDVRRPERTRDLNVVPMEISGWVAIGAGFRGWSAPETWFLDATTESVVSSKSLPHATDATNSREMGPGVVAIRANGWLLQEYVRNDARRCFEFRRYVLWSPGDAEIHAAGGFQAEDRFVAAFANGQVVVAAESLGRRGHQPSWWLALVDPSAGTRMPLQLPDGVALPGFLPNLCGALPSGALVFHAPIEFGANWFARIARLDGDGHLRVTTQLPSVDCMGVVGCPDEESVIVLSENRKILRARFDGSPYEVVFPRNEAKR